METHSLDSAQSGMDPEDTARHSPGMEGGIPREEGCQECGLEGTCSSSPSSSNHACSATSQQFQNRVRDLKCPHCDAQKRAPHQAMPRKNSSWSRTYAITFAILSVIMPAVSANWISEPVDTTVHLGENATLECRAEDANLRTFIWRWVYENGTSQELFIDGKRWGNYVPANLHSPNKSNGFDLVISESTRPDDMRYQCSVSGVQSRGSLEATVRVTVMVAPDDPRITLNKTQPLSEGDYVEFRCSSIQGNPPPTFQWRQNGAAIPGAQTVNVEKFGETYSYFTQQMAMEDHGSTYECEIINAAISSPLVDILDDVDVQFAPRIDLGPHNPMRVVEGDAVELRCSVTANPWSSSGNLFWYKDSIGNGPIGTSETLVIDSVDASDSGTYICTAENTVAESSAEVELDVQFAPKIEIVESAGQWNGLELEVEETWDVDLDCVIEANPPVDGSTIKWFRAGVQVATGTTLEFHPVTKADRADYYCEASNVLEPSEGLPSQEIGQSDIITLRVLYAPGQATVTAPVGVVKGEDAALYCEVDDPGDPIAKLIWQRVGDSAEIHTGETLVFSPAQLSDSGDYKCTPRSDRMGIGVPGQERFDVNEIPEWLVQLPPERTTTIHDTGLDLECRLRGKPPPQIKWYRDGVPVDGSAGYYEVEEQTLETADGWSWDVQSVLLWQGSDRHPHADSLRIEDTANYSCKAANEVYLQGTVMSTMVYVQYEPVMNSSAETVAIDNNQSAVLTCQAHSLPGTTFQWYNGSVELTTGGRIQISSYMTTGAFPYVTVLNISDVQVTDLGYYICRGSNDIGYSDLPIQLTVKTVPHAPYNLQALSSTWESVELAWDPGFDGGYPQDFAILYTAPGHSTIREDVGKSTRHNVTYLFPSLNYTFKVFAENYLGPGPASDNVTVLTDEFTIDAPTEVYYDVETRTLTFQSPSTHYCARIDIHDGSDWDNYEPCAPTAGGSIKIEDGQVVEDIKVALCLERRHDVCSEEVYAEIVDNSDDLPVSVIIIVAVVCGVIVIILSVILIVLCCRRQKAKKKYQEATSRTPQPVMMQPTHKAPPSDVQKASLRGVENPGLDSMDGDDPGIFTTNESLMPHNGNPYAYNRSNGVSNGVPNGHSRYPNGHSNGSARWSNPPSSEPPPSYDNNSLLNTSQQGPYVPVHKPKRKPSDQATLTLDDPYGHDNSKDITSSDSGVSTPDPTKPKKVIYEVIV